MRPIPSILGALGAFATLSAAAPLESTLYGPGASHARSMLGSSFGVPGNQTFDYVVIGGGTAGLAIASRLAEQGAGTVAVIEAGGFYELNNGNLSQIPANDAYYVGKDLDDWQPGVDWGFHTVPQAGAYGRASHYARGKCLGGSSARNYMAYQRGTKSSYQRWADMVGDQSYAWENFLPFFEKSLHFTPANDALRGANATVQYDPAVLGNGQGPLSVTYSHYVQSFATWAQKAFLEMGLAVRNCFQSGELLGQSFGMYTINATTMHRESSETSFLRRALAYPNFMVFQSTLAKRILFDGKKRAVAVQLDTQGYRYTLTARKEVVLSAGAFQSPQLLMVSGVGPAATLQQHGIPLVADRPGVGQNLQDHIIYAPSYRVDLITQSALLNATFEAQANRDYHERAAGIYANPTSDILAWEKIPEPKRSAWLSNTTRRALAQYPADWPEIEFLTMGGFFGYQNNYVRDNPSDGYNYASLAVSLCTPRSRGNVSIASADAAVPPLINPNWLTDPVDVELAVAAFKRARDFFGTSALKPVLIGDEYFPGERVATDAQIEDHVRKSFDTIFHASCTCAMGKREDQMAVVDSKARVIGVDALRVVDASAFPMLPPGHPQSTIYALAEKIACDISGAC
ncbi:GMC family oxidoreductase [Aspergillus clavatus NRRL 1]|uniref:Patulin synthase n=1 Tax=Aspergillus clavatus (strain ATCC 1007 / CBS 513.65 / DSM 816 / NCTC 3887 / NRRL 1 / QM 1276 / 107) TaxID=344612 RepID=PATE_ASPCL|nr:glucose-methanol-choline (gmc) oxidoreductase [Aspergillus clavatus NRRL 1]A1CFL2.1 RecName: Full=Patulin synthase; AltName: Full=Dehydrogenase patE; AltName: Full=Patulin synthesis protein E; Flags: Precursor [Aspergillus clavatus NRRL 1]EAW11661.1 glucose-methanol-choline (gmc) oxidoreductase [Aspergillus clavatus NRRL 1]